MDLGISKISFGDLEVSNISIGDLDITSMYFGEDVYKPNNEIKYVSTDGQIVTPYNTTGWGANIVSNTYSDGKGIIKFNKNVEFVPDYAFRGCTTLLSITLPNTVEVIGYNSYRECRSLSSITIPNSVTTISDFAFNLCTILKTIYAYPTIAPSISNDTFSVINNNGVLHYPSGSNYSNWLSKLSSGWRGVADL